MVTVTKARMATNSKIEEQIYEVDLMNCLLEDRDKCASYLIEKQGFVDYYNRTNQFGAHFSLFDNVFIEDFVDKNKALQSAKGYYNHIQKLTGSKKHKKEIYGAEEQYSYQDEEHEDQLLENVYLYDLNMAYLSVFKNGIYPNTDGEEYGPGMVESDQIGFSNIDGEHLIVIEEGFFAQYRFGKAYSSKLQEWANKIYAKRGLLKSQGKNAEASELKTAIVSALGMISNNNIFLRAYITGTISNYMRNLIDENTIIANTDSIISIGPRPDLEIGNGLGQFKIEQENKYMIHEGRNYIIYADKDRKIPLVNKWSGRLKGAQEGYDPLTGITSTPQNYEKIGDYIYGKKDYGRL